MNGSSKKLALSTLPNSGFLFRIVLVPFHRLDAEKQCTPQASLPVYYQLKFMGSGSFILQTKATASGDNGEINFEVMLLM